MNPMATKLPMIRSHFFVLIEVNFIFIVSANDSWGLRVSPQHTVVRGFLDVYLRKHNQLLLTEQIAKNKSQSQLIILGPFDHYQTQSSC